MKIAFFSNYLNHHQLPLCQEFLKIENVEFTFVATEIMPQYRFDMKYEDMNTIYSFVLCAYENTEKEEEARRLALDADVVIIGSAPNFYIEERLNRYNKLTYRYCERSLKKGTWRRFIPRVKNRIYEEYLQFKDKNFYVLGASAFAGADLVFCGFPEDKCFRWGYFPKVEIYPNPEYIVQNKISNSLVWIGRMIDWKHPEAALKIANELNKLGIEFTLKLIGDGPLRHKLEKYVSKHNLQNKVIFCGMLSNTEVRKILLESEIFLLNSDFQEGWGAVLNEAMNSLCVPIVSHACGSAAFLVEQGENGFIYQYGKGHKVALRRVMCLLKNEEMRKQMALNAYDTLRLSWNAEIAVKRLCSLECSDIEYENGPCSKDAILKNNWFKEKKRL